MRRVGLWKRIATIGVTASMLLTNVSPGFAGEVLEASAETTAQELETVSIESAVEGSEDFEAIDDTVLAEEEFSVEEEPTQDEDIILAEDSSENGLASEGIIEEEFLNAAEGEMATVTWDAGEGKIQYWDEDEFDFKWGSSKVEQQEKDTYLDYFVRDSELQAPEGYAFSGWLCDGDPIDFSETYDDTGVWHLDYMVSGDVTFVADWKRLATITWDAGAGKIRTWDDGEEKWMNSLTGEQMEGTYLNNVPGEEGLQGPEGTIFGGWLLNGEPIVFSFDHYDDEYGWCYDYEVGGDVTFTADWKEKATVTWDAGAGEIRSWGSEGEVWGKTRTKDQVKGTYLTDRYGGDDLKGPDGTVFAGWLLDGEPYGFDYDEGHYDLLVDRDITFVADWKETVDVTWDAGEGEICIWEDGEEKWVHTTTERIAKGSAIYAGYDMRAPEGMTFSCWLLNGEPVEFNWEDDDGNWHNLIAEEPVTFTASWKEAATVTWDAGEGEIEINDDEETWGKTKTISIAKGDYLYRYPDEEELKAPTGKVFAGWLLNGKPFKFTWNDEDDHYDYQVTDNVTFTASWKEAVTVTWDAGEGEIEIYDDEEEKWTWGKTKTISIAKGDYLDRYPDEEELKAPAGKAFAGWLLNGEPISFHWESEEDEGHYDYLVEDNVTFTASWKETATVTWDAGEGTIRIGEHYVDEQGWVTDWSSFKEVDNIKGDYLDSYPDEEELKAPDGKTFAGWLLNGKPIKFTRIDDHYDYRVTDNVIFTASWKEVVTVTWNAGDGEIERWDNEEGGWVWGETMTVSMAKDDYLDSYPDEEELKAPDGKVFAGWLLNGKPIDFTLIDEDDHYNYQVTGNVTFTASWKEAVTVTWNAGEGFIRGEEYDEEEEDWVETWNDYREVIFAKGDYLGGIPEDDEMQAPDGKAFAGWLLNGKPIEFTWNNEDGQDGHYDYQVTDNVTFTASWKKAVTITWDAGEGTIQNGGYYDEEKDEWVPTWDSSREDVYAQGAYLTFVPSEEGNYIQAPEGKDFAGWLLNGEPFIFTSVGSGFDWHYDYLVNDDVTFTAVYGDSVNISWDAGIGTFRTWNPETGKAEDVRKIEETQAKGSYIKHSH